MKYIHNISAKYNGLNLADESFISTIDEISGISASNSVFMLRLNDRLDLNHNFAYYAEIENQIEKVINDASI